MKKTTRTLLILSSVVILLGACTKKSSENTQHSPSTQANTAETKTITDHAGNTVEIPVNPQRIASLSSPFITPMLIEVEAPIVGTATSMKDNKPTLREAYELFNIKFEDTDYYNYGQGGKDIEQIKVSKPDIIIGLVTHANVYNVLSEIAPTVLVDFRKGMDMYRDLAIWIQKEKSFNAQMKKYKNRIKKIQKKFSILPEKQIVAGVFPNLKKDKVYVYANYGFMRVAYDLGFSPTQFAEKNLSTEGSWFSPEIFEELVAADYVMSVYYPTYDQTKESLYSVFDSVVPGWKKYMTAYENNTFIVLKGEISRSPTFKSYDYVLDEFENYAR